MKLSARKHVGEVCGSLPLSAKTVKAPLPYCPAGCLIQYTFAHPGMPHQSQYYVLGAFLLGVVLTAAYNKRSSLGEEATDNVDMKKQLQQQQKLISRFTKINDLDTLKKCLVEIQSSLEKGEGSIKEGIEGCIGDTPLIKIKSLSDYTGCE
jgi:cysteine synthase A